MDAAHRDAGQPGLHGEPGDAGGVDAAARAGVPERAAGDRGVAGGMRRLPDRTGAAGAGIALDSEYDYDKVWAKCVELKVVPAFSTPPGTPYSVSRIW